MSSPPPTCWDLLAVALRARRAAAGYLASRPWLPWLAPVLFAFAYGTLVTLRDWMVATCPLPVHATTVLVFCCSAALCTAPLFLWVRVPTWLLIAMVLHALYLTQYLAKATAEGFGRLPGLCCGLIDLGLAAYIAGECALYAVTQSEAWLRRSVYALYTTVLPLAIVPQVVALVVLAAI